MLFVSLGIWNYCRITSGCSSRMIMLTFEALQLLCSISGHDEVAAEQSSGLNNERIPSVSLTIFIRVDVGKESKE